MSARLALLLCGAAAAATGSFEAQWQGLIEARETLKAKDLCESRLASKDLSELVEARKCLASVEAAGSGGADKALAQLDAAAALSPEDVSVSEARLRILIGARRFAELPAALEKAVKAHPGKDGLEVWLIFCSELQEAEWYEEGLAYTKVLEKYFPKDHRVIANMGGFLGLLKNYPEALPYAKRAVALKPDDPTDNWNLARVYDSLDKADLADRFYRKAIKLQTDPEERKDSDCLYSEFLLKRHRPGADKYELEHCPGGVPEGD